MGASTFCAFGIFSQHPTSSLYSRDAVGRCILQGPARAGSASEVQNNLRCTQPDATQTKSDGAHWLRSQGWKRVVVRSLVFLCPLSTDAAEKTVGFRFLQQHRTHNRPKRSERSAWHRS